MLNPDVLLLILLLFLSGIFSSSEIAYVSLSQARVESLVKKGVRCGKLIRRLKEKPQKLLIVILLGNNLVNIGASVLTTAVAYEMFEHVQLSVVTGVLTALILIFGEIFPKTFAQRRAELIAQITAYPLLDLIPRTQT